MKKHILATLVLFGGIAHAQDFPQNLILGCKVGKQLHNVELGSELFDGKGGTLRKAGMVGLRWGGGAKPVWANAERQADGSFKAAFPGRKPMTIKVLRKPVDEYDSDPILTIQEEGGKAIQCAQALG